jgi:hypothetical protein
MSKAMSQSPALQEERRKEGREGGKKGKGREQREERKGREGKGRRWRKRGGRVFQKIKRVQKHSEG